MSSTRGVPADPAADSEPLPTAGASGSAPVANEAGAATIDVVINGESRAVPFGLTISELLAHLGLAGKRVAVERNRVIAPRATHPITLVCDGDRLELVTFVGGG